MGDRCDACGGHFDELSRQATQNQMGAWFVRDSEQPFLPGCSYETLVKLVRRGKIDRETIVRGPTTRQFWMLARDAPGVAHLLGLCHRCDQTVSPSDVCCEYCGAPFSGLTRRNELGLAPALNTETIAATKAQSARLARDSAGAVGRDRLAALVAERRLREQSGDRASARSAGANGGGGVRPPSVAAAKSTRDLGEVGFVQRIRRLRRVVGALALLNVLILVGVIAFALWSPSWFAQRRADSSSTTQTATKNQAPVDRSPTPDAPDETESEPIVDEAATSSNPGVDEPMNPDSIPPDTNPPGLADAPAVPDWQVAFDEAVTLARSDDADDVERALQLLLGLREALTESDGLEDLEPLIEMTRRRLTRLRLDEVFGEDGGGG